MALAAVVTTGIGVTTAARRNSRDEPVKPPVLTFENTGDSVRVHVHNVNKHWGLRNQRVTIGLRHANGMPIRTYGPTGTYTVDAKPGPSIECCLITLLRPEGDFTFIVWPPYPNDFIIKAVTVDVSGSPGWIKM